MIDRQRRTKRTGAVIAPVVAALAGLVAAGYRFGRAARPAGQRNRLFATLFGRPRTRPPARHRRGVFLMADILLQLVDRFQRHDTFAIAAQVAFYAFLAIFPALAAFGFFYTLIGDPEQLARAVEAVSFLLPTDVTAVLSEHAGRLAGIAGASVGMAGLLSFSLVVFSASSGMMALFEGLNTAFECVETRSLIGLRARAIVMTLTAILFLTTALVIVGRLQVLAADAGIHHTIVSLLRWPAAVTIAAIGLASLYHYGPDRSEARWRFFTPGSVTAAVSWVAVSHVLAWYLATFPGFGITYGSLAALAGFLFWVWLTTIVVLLGAELDATVEVPRR
jgi:membrane protein